MIHEGDLRVVPRTISRDMSGAAPGGWKRRRERRRVGGRESNRAREIKGIRERWKEGKRKEELSVRH